MQSNFTFLQQEFPEIYREIADAEKHTFTAPRYAALLCRSALEKTLLCLSLPMGKPNRYLFEI